MAQEQKTFNLSAEVREVVGKASKRLLKRNMVPGVVYGHNVETKSVQIKKRDFDQVYLRAGNTVLVDLSVGEGGKPQKVFIHDVQRNPLNHEVSHVDFMVVNLKEEMTMSVPVVLVGESPVVRSGEGLMLHQTEHVMLKALPLDIPPLLEVDISDLSEIDQAIHVSDIQLPPKVTLMSSPDDLIVKITEMPMAEEVEEVPEAEAEGEAEGAAEATEEGEANGGEGGEDES